MKSGDIISFNYTAARRDARPLVLLVDVNSEHVRGINLHYLPFKRALAALEAVAGKGASYSQISADPSWKNAFRVYKAARMSKREVLDWSKLEQKLRSMTGLPPDRRNALSTAVKNHVASGRRPDVIPSIIQAALANPESI